MPSSGGPTSGRSVRTKAQEAFRTIGEASAATGVEPHVLRFWETKFSRLKPLTRAGGRRYYRPSDIDLIRRIKQLLHEDGMTIRGAQKLLQGRPLTAEREPSTPEAFDRPARPANGADDGNSNAGWRCGNALADKAFRDAVSSLAAEARSVAAGGPIPPFPAPEIAKD